MKTESRVRLDKFDPGQGFTRGRPRWVEAIWYLAKMAFFLSALPWPNGWKARILRAFGARVGIGVMIKPRVNIHFPWRLQIGDYSCLGEGVEIYNFEMVTLGSHCCISQRAMLCAANHDYRDPTLKYRNAPIEIGDGVWVCACAFVGPGVTLGDEAVISVGSIVTKNMPAGMVCSGNPCAPVKARWLSNAKE